MQRATEAAGKKGTKKGLVVLFLNEVSLQFAQHKDEWANDQSGHDV